jgi:hypothetical protein
MNALVYAACFRELSKEASLSSFIAQRAAGVGNSALHLGGDIGKTVGHTFNPASWKSGWEIMRGKGKLETGMFVVPTAAFGATTALSDKDPVTGRPMGAFERAGLVASGIGSSLASHHVGGGGFLRNAAVGLGAQTITDRLARTGGRFIDRVAGTVPANPSQAAPRVPLNARQYVPPGGST